MANPCSLRTEVARARLLSLGLTQAQIAERCGVELRTLQRWFAGGRVSLEDAERFASTCGMGTSELFDGVPDASVSPLARLRALLAWVRLRESELGHAMHATLENFGFIDAFVDFSAHPTRGYVRRLPIETVDRHGFLRLRIVPVAAETRFTFGGQVARRFRYAFGEIVVRGGRVALVESFHTRSALATPRADGSFDVHAWVGADMRELVVGADRDFTIERVASDAARDRTSFDLNDPSTAHAVCFRPAAMHLRDAGLASHFDRVRGSRDGRIDVLVD